MNFIDLFAGCGGLSEGFVKAGYTAIAHVEMDASACRTLATRAAWHYLSETGERNQYYSYLRGLISYDRFMEKIPDYVTRTVINRRIDESSIGVIYKEIDNLLGDRTLDIVIGGPPCQAYSVAGRSRNPGRMVGDPRNNLYKFYAEFLRKYQPRYFVFENVPGLKTAENHLSDIIALFESENLEYNTKYKVVNASDYGVMQHRKRILIIGSKGLPVDFELMKLADVSKFQIMKDLFSDLPPLHPGDAPGICSYLSRSGEYLLKSRIRDRSRFVTQHICRPHIERDLRIYKLAIDRLLRFGRRLQYSELPDELKTHKNQSSFLDRFKVVDPYGLSHTMVAHISKDGHYYIHPDPEQIRSISVREAARIQSFPDNYYFEGSRTSAFHQIGNAVPPLLAKAVAQMLIECSALEAQSQEQDREQNGRV